MSKFFIIKSVRLLLIALMACFLVGCADKFVTDWVKEQESRKEIGSPVKCPNCSYGWGFVFDNESNDDPIYCLWSGPSLSQVELDDDNYYNLKGWLWKPSKEEWSGWKNGIDDFSKHLKKLKRYENLMFGKPLNYCYSEFTYNQSLEPIFRKRIAKQEQQERDKFNEELNERYREIEAAKSPEQKELEKINRQLKELKDEIKKRK